MPEDRHPGLHPHPALDLFPEQVAYAYELLMPALVPDMVGYRWQPDILPVRTFGNDHDREFLAGLVPGHEVFTDLLHSEVYFRDKDLVSSSGYACHDGDPAYVSPHNLDNDNPVVRFCRGVQPVYCFCHGRHGRIEADGCISSHDIVVDRLWDPNDRDPFLRYVPRRRKGPVPAYDNDGMEPEFFHVLLDLLEIPDLF